MQRQGTASTVVRRAGRRSRFAKQAPEREPPPLLTLHRELQRLSRRIPAKEWDKFPSDFLANLDEYLSGTADR